MIYKAHKTCVGLLRIHIFITVKVSLKCEDKFGVENFEYAIFYGDRKEAIKAGLSAKKLTNFVKEEMALVVKELEEMDRPVKSKSNARKGSGKKSSGSKGRKG